MHLILFSSLLVAAAPPVKSVPTGPTDTDTVHISLTLAPPMVRFTQSSDFCAVLAGDAGAGFGANPAVLGWAGPNGLSASSHYASRMPVLNLPSLHDFSQSFAVTEIGGPQLRLGAGVGIRSMAMGPGRSAVEYAFGLGRRMDESGKVIQDLGLSLRAVIPEGSWAPDGTAPSPGLMADLGYLVTLGGFLRAGATLENLGNGVAGVRPELNILSDNYSQAASLSYTKDPGFSLTPMTLSLGAALFRSWDGRAFHVIDASLAGTWAKRPGEGPGNQSFTTVALDAVLLRSLGCQLGFMRDPSSAELQGKFGLSLRLFNHVRLTYAEIGATGGRELYDGQKGFSLAISNLLRWHRQDLTWWRRSP